MPQPWNENDMKAMDQAKDELQWDTLNFREKNRLLHCLLHRAQTLKSELCRNSSQSTK